MSRQARQKRPVAEWQREQSVLPMHSAVVLRLLQRGQSSSPHSFFWRQKWQVMPADSKGGTHRRGVQGLPGPQHSTAQHATAQNTASPEAGATSQNARPHQRKVSRGFTHLPRCHTWSHVQLLRSASPGTVSASPQAGSRSQRHLHTHGCEFRGEKSLEPRHLLLLSARPNSIQTVTEPKMHSMQRLPASRSLRPGS